MNKEIEAKFFITNKDLIRKKLSSSDFTLIKREFLMKRKTFHSELSKGWMRIRDEGDKITMTYKEITGSTINDVNEIEIIVNNFEEASKLLCQTSFKETSYQENYREIWRNQDVEVVIDTWPYLQSYIEIEGKSEDIVKEYSNKLGFNFDKDAYFGGVDVLYKKAYNIDSEDFCKIPTITFNNEDFHNQLLTYTKNY